MTTATVTHARPSVRDKCSGGATPDRVGRATCCYCGVGCVVNATVRGNQVVKISADREAKPNYGMLCPKGAYLYKANDPQRRLTQPMLRKRRDEPLRPVSWDEAIRYVADRLTTIRRTHGRDALAYYGSGQLDTEASYVFNKLFKGGLGCNHTDTNSRLCMSSAVAAYKAAFGSDGPPTSYDDIQHADVFLIIGANMASNHPVLFNMVRKRRSTAANCRVIVCDPRKTKTADHADVHVPLAPGSDVAFLQLVARRLMAMGRVHHSFIGQHTEGFDAYKAHLDALDEGELLSTCGVHPARIDEVVYMLAQPSRLLTFYCMGVNQSSRGVDKNAAIINLHLQLGEVGAPGCGPFSLTGQPNAMGGREVGYLSHQLPGYRFVADAEHRATVERAWGMEPGAIHPEPGLTAVPLFTAAARGQMKAMWIACTNPVVSMPDANVAQRGLERADLVIVQDCFHPTETTQYADVLLPAATWGEKSGTMTNSERLVTRSNQFLDAPGEAKPDWWIAAAVAQEMGLRGFDYASAEEVWDEYRLLTAGTPCNQAGMTNQRLREGPLQWPCPHEHHPGTPRRYTHGRFDTPGGRARFITQGYAPPAEATDPTYPLVLTTGRVASQWHTRTRTGHISELVRPDPEPFVEMHPDDAATHRCADGQWVEITSSRGLAQARLRITDRIRRGLVFMPFHWGDLFHPHTNVNDVTHAACDSVSQQPELKYCAVRVTVPVPKPSRVGDESDPSQSVESAVEVCVEA